MGLVNRPKRGTFTFILRQFLSLIHTLLSRIKEAADKWGFVAQSLGLVWKDARKQASF